MEMIFSTEKLSDPKDFEMPKAECILFDTEDVITTSGTGNPFDGDWDVNLPTIDF